MRITLDAHKFFLRRAMRYAAYATEHWGIHICVCCGRWESNEVKVCEMGFGDE